MKKKWEAKEVIHDFSTISTEEYNQLLDEWAEIVYGYLCQLSEKKVLVTNNSMPNKAGRTGTDG